MLKSFVLILFLVAGTPIHAYAASTRWVADYMGGAPLTNLNGPIGLLTIHVEFDPAFTPTPGTTVRMESVSSMTFAVKGGPAFPAAWQQDGLGIFQLTLDANLVATNWWAYKGQNLDIGAPQNIQMAGSYKDGADGEGFWETANVIDRAGVYLMTGGQSSVTGTWTLTQVPEVSTTSLLLLGLVPTLLAGRRRTGAAEAS